MIKKQIVILYHADCNDGFGAAWAAWKKFGDTAAYLAVHYSEPVPEGLKNKEIYFLDFCYDGPEMNRLMKENKRVTAIDHHVTREHIVKQTEQYAYAVDHSGAVLAWKYFHPKKEIPKLLLWIEDSDLWKFAVPHTHEVITFLKGKQKELKLWDKLVRQAQNTTQRKAMIAKGAMLREFEEVLIQKIIDQSITPAEFEGYKTFVVNGALWRSEIGNMLTKQLPPIGIVWVEKDGKRIVSLRSIGDTDVAKIAEKYGGGGHKNAAGFTISTSKPTPWKIVQ